MNLLLRLSAACICVLMGTGIAASVLTQSPMPQEKDSFTSFVEMKRAQAVVDEDVRWTLAAGGDVMLSRYVAQLIKKNSVDWPWEQVSGLFTDAEVSFINLENPVLPGPVMPTEGLVFRADPESLAGAAHAGIDVVSLSNNHQSDVGREYVQNTVNAVKDAGLSPVGAGANDAIAHQAALVEAAGQTIAFLAYGDPRFSNQVHFATSDKPGIALADAELMQRDIALAQKQADMVVVSIHAGAEYREEPDALQRELLDAAADAGADIVLGHHPHVIQPLWQRGTAWVIASLGNLIFDQEWSDETRRGMVLKMMMNGSDVSQIEAVPVFLSEGARPFIQTDGAAASLDRLQSDLKTATVIAWKGIEQETMVTERGMPLQADPVTGFSIHRSESGDLNDNATDETYVLENGDLTVRENGLQLWVSPANWWVQDFSLADIDGNDHLELVMSVWKSGSYGSSKPFWVEEDDLSVKNHVFVFTLDSNAMLPVWQSSNLDHPNCELLMKDLDGDGIDELVVLEGSYREDGGCIASYAAVWKWNTWGFFNEWRSDAGLYWDLRSEQSGSGHLVIVNGSAQ